jgi:hypothetical protein
MVAIPAIGPKTSFQIVPHSERWAQISDGGAIVAFPSELVHESPTMVDVRGAKGDYGVELHNWTNSHSVNAFEFHRIIIK